MKPRMLLILEDDDERIAAFERAAAEISPPVHLKIWRNAYAFVAEAGAYLPTSVLISLDHDLNVQADGTRDPGDGLAVATWLAGQPPACPVIIHSSNHERVESMINELRFAKWAWERVVPFGDDWIGQHWLKCATRLLSNGASHSA